MSEKAISFGFNNGFMGVISEPEGNAIIDAPIMIILNTGIGHKAGGSFRISVDIARSVQKEGFTCLRFDLSGLGDSKMRISNGKEDLPVTDVIIAMDYLCEKYGTSKFVLMGLCSGSDNSHRTAVADDRVIGTINLDGYGYRNNKYYINHYGKRLSSLKYINQKLKNKLRKKENVKIESNQADAYVRKFPPFEQSRTEFSALSHRNVKMLYMFTGGVGDYYNYKNQFRDVFNMVDFKNNLELEYYIHANHSFSWVYSRQRIVNKILNWMVLQFK